MHTHDPTRAALASWTQLEDVVERLHAAARSSPSLRDFYRQLLADGASALGASAAAAWRVRPGGPSELIAQSVDADFGELGQLVERRDEIDRAAKNLAAAIQPAPARDDDPAGAYDWLLCPVRLSSAGEGDAAGESAAAAILELWLPAGAGPLVQRGWLDFATTLADVAADFHALDELRRLRTNAAMAREAVDVLHRIGQARGLEEAVFAAANEGRRLLECDRVTVVIRRGRAWRVAAASGVDRPARRTEFAQRAARLADQIAKWGEPVTTFSSSATTASDDHSSELPTPLSAALEAHVDHSHARELAAAPVSSAARADTPTAEDAADRPRRRGDRAVDFVIIAERFETSADSTLVRQLVEYSDLCAPALARAAELDRFPVRTLLGLSRRLAAFVEPRRLSRTALVVLAIAAAVAALVFVPADFDVEAPATLSTIIERDVFATSSGAVAEVRVRHGQQVAEGEVLAVLSDPDLALQLQQTRGEIDSTRERLAAIAVARTERDLREQQSGDRLPLSAEQRELEERLAGLTRQLELLQKRTDELTLRSPRAGQVLTRDVESLLQSRPVERGQVLVTIADPASGWRLAADVPQRDIGHVLDAQQNESPQLAVSYRLAGDVEQTYEGHIEDVSVAAALDAEGLEDEAPPVKVRIAVDGPPPAAARPGMTATVRIHCGQRPLGYVWLHDVAATLYRWATF